MIRQRIEDGLCPRCGSTRPARAEECPNCRVVYAKYEAALRKRQLETPQPPSPRREPDWNRLPLYAGIAALAVLLWNAGALWHRGLATVDEATRINAPATGGAALALLAFACARAEGGTIVARGEVQNRTQRPLALAVDLAWTERADQRDTTRHDNAALTPQPLPPLAVGRFELDLRRAPDAVADCHVAGFAERDGSPIAFDDVHG